jgi:hypothetical protein
MIKVLNPDYTPFYRIARSNLTIVINANSKLCHQFTDPREQQSILDVLVYTDTKHAWPTKEIQDRLKDSWGWSGSMEVTHPMS